MFDSQKRHHRISYAQNFLKNPSLARYIVKLAKLDPQDTVVEIGPGEGIITRALFECTKNLILVEKDKELFQKLHDRYQNEKTVKIIATNALEFKPPQTNYKVFSNPPFNITSQLVKKFVLAPNSPNALFLFLQKEAQRRLSGKSGENQLSILIKSFYRIKEIHEFARTDFSPVPAVDVNLIGFFKYDTSIMPEDKTQYILFVQFGWQQQKSTLAKNFEQIFTYEQWKRLAQNNGFNIKALPIELTPDQWIGLFNYYKTGVSLEKQRIIQSFTPKQ